MVTDRTRSPTLAQPLPLLHRQQTPRPRLYSRLMPMVTLSHVIQELEHDDQHERIKKLLIYTCYDTWEDDPTVLESITMRELVQTALSQSPSLEELELLLEELVDSVTKPVVYAKVGDRILEALEPLYSENQGEEDSKTAVASVAQGNGTLPAQAQAQWSQGQTGGEEQTAWLSANAPAPSSPANSVYQRTLYVLSHTPNEQRLKKLLLCACQNIWESDLDQLEAIPWVDLVNQARMKFPHLGAVEASLREVVQALSKPQVYEPIAQELLQILTSLYEEGPALTDPAQGTQFNPGAAVQPKTGASTGGVARSAKVSAAGPSSSPLQAALGDTSGMTTGFQTVANLVPQRTWRKLLRKRYSFLAIGGLALVVTTHNFLKHYNPFRPHDICFSQTFSPSRKNYVVYAPVRCSNRATLLGPGVGAVNGQLSFRDVDKDGQVDYVVAPEPLGCRLGIQGCPREGMTAVSVELGYNPVFTVIEQN